MWKLHLNCKISVFKQYQLAQYSRDSTNTRASLARQVLFFQKRHLANTASMVTIMKLDLKHLASFTAFEKMAGKYWKLASFGNIHELCHFLITKWSIILTKFPKLVKLTETCKICPTCIYMSTNFCQTHQTWTFVSVIAKMNKLTCELSLRSVFQKLLRFDHCYHSVKVITFTLNQGETI